jgi:hypothetical protein
MEASIASMLRKKSHPITHTSLGHVGVENCMQQIKQAYHIKNLVGKVRKFIAGCDTCQRVKFPNRAFVAEQRSYLPTKPGSLCAIDLWQLASVTRGREIHFRVTMFFETCKTIPAEGMSEQADWPLFCTYKTRSNPVR